VIDGYDIREFEPLFILFLTMLNSGDLSFENFKPLHDELLYDKFEFLPKTYMIHIYIMKPLLIYATCFPLSLVNLYLILKRVLSCF